MKQFRPISFSGGRTCFLLRQMGFSVMPERMHVSACMVGANLRGIGGELKNYFL